MAISTLLPWVRMPPQPSGSAGNPAIPSQFTGWWWMEMGDALKDDALKDMKP